MNTYSEYPNVQRVQSYEAAQQSEGRIARRIEKQTAKLPSDVFLWAAGAAMIGSALFEVLGPPPRTGIFGKHIEGRAPLATFLGQWVPTLLLLGIYNKIVKVAGSDRVSR